MRWLSCLLLICAGMAAEEPAKPGSHAAASQSKKAQPRKAPVLPAVPAGAVEVSPGLYRWRDKEGNSWMYRRTPFGVSRWAEDSEDTKQEAVINLTTAVDQGDAVRFERATPFGKRAWVRKKTELDELEQKIWARQQEKIAASRKAEKE